MAAVICAAVVRLCNKVLIRGTIFVFAMCKAPLLANSLKLDFCKTYLLFLINYILILSLFFN